MKEGFAQNEIDQELCKLEAAYNKVKQEKLDLNMSRGKPSEAQLDLAVPMLYTTKNENFKTETNIDCRNYGMLGGIPEMKEIFAQMMGVWPKQVFVCDNSSLRIMYDIIVKYMMFGVSESDTPWKDLPKVKFLCPVPGYDRHFAICQQMGIEMIPVDMTPQGPNMDQVEALVAADEAIKGIWCVPKYSNPDGFTYSDETVERFANMQTKATDFRIFWDNAYAVHDLTDEGDTLKNLYQESFECGTNDRVIVVASTSKISFAGAGVAAFAASESNIAYLQQLTGIQTIGPDKMNQLRHARFFKNYDGILQHMKKHAVILKPKFDTVIQTLEKELAPMGLARWNNPKGGYFISIFVQHGCAAESIRLAREAGLVVTAAGSTYPYRKDPNDSNIRIAPTYPALPELQKAMDVLCLCIKIATLRKWRENQNG